MLKVHLQSGNMHFLSSAEVFSIFPIVYPIGREPKRTAKISRLPLLPKDFLICCVLSIVTHYCCLSSNILLKGL
jgi:hypothetical protein